MTSDESKLFLLLDEYSRKHHQCFLAEMLPNSSRTEYTLCFRPAQVSAQSADRYSCRYIHAGTVEARIAAETGALSPALIERLDEELLHLDK
jgi:hypothetical protein